MHFLFKLEDDVMVRAIKEVGKVKEVREADVHYWVQFGANFATRKWFKQSELSKPMKDE
jgi:hypothetical protein